MKQQTPYYEKQLERGLIFQDFVYEVLNRHGISTVAYSSRVFQLNKGENKAKMEIKFDDKLAETGNLWIEIAEKSNPQNRVYIDSGILRDCNEYVIGNYDVVYRLPVSILRLLLEKQKYQIRENRLRTSKGFLLPAAEAARIAIQVIPCKCAEEMRSFLDSQNGSKEAIESHIQEMLRAIKCDPNQISMFEDLV